MRKGLKKQFTAAVLAVFTAGMLASSAFAGEDRTSQKDMAVEYLKSAIADKCPMVTYETEDPLISSASYTYENAIAAIALMSEGDYETAGLILDALTAGMEKDKVYSDRFRNAYMAGKASDLPGYWNDEAKKWFQDEYQVGTGTKSSCAAAVALMIGYKETQKDEYLNAAASGVSWVINNCADDTPGFTSGYTGWPQENVSTTFTYKSTADNIWMYAAASMLGAATGWEIYTDAASSAREFVTESMYSAGDSRFFQGTEEDGETPVTNLICADIQALTALCFGDESGLDNMDSCLTSEGGYSYDNSNTDGFWLEGTAIAALALSETDDPETSEQALAAMDALQLSSGAFPQASIPTLATGEKDTEIYNWPSTGVCGWYILAVNGYNPLLTIQ
ncbi:MAG: hypothetical protein IJ899_04360 [Blautia sp.]|nr:hypothetical protein [Blautia sp.]